MVCSVLRLTSSMGMSLDECLQDLNTKAVAYKAARDEIRKTEAFLRVCVVGTLSLTC